MRLTMRVYGLRETEDALENMALRLSDPATDALGRALEDVYERRWADWAGTDYTLYRTGRLKESFTEDGGEAIRRAHGGAYQFGSKVPYSRFHVGKLLERLSSHEQELLAEAMADYIVAERPSWWRPRDARGRFVKA